LAGHQRQVDLVGFALAKLLLQDFQSHAFFGNQEHAAGFAVQPVHQLQKIMAGPGHAHLLDHAKGHTAAAMHRDTGRLVDGQHMLVLKKNRELP
jgi:hypothetical protein